MARPGVPGSTVGNVGAVNEIVAGAFVQPNTYWWWGLQNNAGFYKAFNPVAALLGQVGTDAPVLAAALAQACDCMNNNVCLIQ